MARQAQQRTQQTTTPAGCAFTAIGLLVGAIALIMWVDGLTVGAVLILGLYVAGLIGYSGHRTRQEAERRRLHAIQSTEVARYHVMNPRDFEQAIAYLCQRDGCRDARVVGGAGDLGADVIATAPDGRRVVIQCKRYGPTTKVGSPDLQRFGGTCYTVHGAHVATVVTTSVFTRPAAEYARQHRIRLFDSAALGAWASRTGPAPWM
ncbi:restriction endonuclease [Streptomyces sp. ISL-36]|uniref:restriction endonuclease n=1 Tax=Streptomyces sp. ISL-36 TaxID=2819182 RepID=UPI001BED04AF|nr:restriction endonuclease [Streptomyces sp. ISL-36]MBT2440310.1 restriction endonuclease [Streptomyces sp. ISL-36]